MRSDLTAPKADALPGCATPRLAERLGNAAVDGNPGDAVRGNERQNKVGTGNESPGVSPNPSTTAHEDQYAPEPVSGERPVMWGDIYTCTGCRDLEECRAAFGDKWSPDGTGCADWTPRRVTLAHLHLREGEG